MVRSVRRVRLCPLSSVSGAPHPACRADLPRGWHLGKLHPHPSHTCPAQETSSEPRSVRRVRLPHPSVHRGAPHPACRPGQHRGWHLSKLPTASVHLRRAAAGGSPRLRSRRFHQGDPLRATLLCASPCAPRQARPGGGVSLGQPHFLPHTRGPSVVAYARRGVRSPVRRAVSALGGRCRNARWVSLRWSVCYGVRSCTRRVVGKHHVLCMQQPNSALKRTRREASSCFAGIVPARRLALSLGVTIDPSQP